MIRCAPSSGPKFTGVPYHPGNRIQRYHPFFPRKEFLTNFDQTNFYYSFLILRVVNSTRREENYHLVIGNFMARRKKQSRLLSNMLSNAFWRQTLLQGPIRRLVSPSNIEQTCQCRQVSGQFVLETSPSHQQILRQFCLTRISIVNIRRHDRDVSLEDFDNAQGV